MQFEHPAVLGLIIPTIIVGLYMMKKAKRKELIISRIIVAALLITALASPFIVVPRVTTNDNPDLVIISDETASMGLFKNGTATELYEVMTAKTPTAFIKLTGDSTALGDAIVQYSTGDNQIVLVTDGNSNYGEDVESALQFAQEMGTTVYLVQPELENNDFTVQIEGDKTAVLNTKTNFEIVVNPSEGDDVSYSFELYVDDELQKGYQTSQKRVPYTHEFTKLGAHTLKVVITPSEDDSDTINNVFYKTVFVVPKAKALLITNEGSSEFARKLYNLYDLDIANDISTINDFSGQKVIIFDNIHELSISSGDAERLKEYVSSGHGLYVIGGDKAFDEGNYLNSSFEELLPVISKPTESTGGKYMILVLDLSGSTTAGGEGTITVGRVTQTAPTYPYIIRSAQNILTSPDYEDATLGIIALGNYDGEIPDEMYELIVPQNQELLNESLNSIQMRGGQDYQTDLNQALIDSRDMINNFIGDDVTVQKSIIIISDGSAGPDLALYDTSNIRAQTLFNTAQELVNSNYFLYFIHIKSNYDYQKDSEGNVLAKEFFESVGGTYKYAETGISELTQNETAEEQINETISENQSYFEVYEYNQKHFITLNLNVTGNITGYNQVTPKAGSERLLITNNGANVLTTWRYGLGRVAALSTDDGKANGWSNDLYYYNENLTSTIVNWAIANPIEETGAVIEAPDMWYGTPETIELTMYDEGIPKLLLDGEEIELSVTGDSVYEAVINPSPIGIHDLSGYPVAVNYAIEYRDVGLNNEFAKLINAYGGTTYNSVSEARSKLLTEAKNNSEKLVRESVSQKIYFLIAALIIFLGEVILRRIKEIKEMKQLEQEIRKQN